MSDNGYCIAYRKSWTHPAFKDLREAAIWNFLYQNAFWEDGERNFNGHTFQLKRGEIVVSVSFLAKGFGMTDKGVRVVIQKLIKLGMLVKRGANKGTILTICNYDRFQTFEKTKGEHEGKRGANEGQTRGNNKKERKKEETKINNNELVVPDFISVDVWNDFVKHRGAKFSKLAATRIINQLTEWHNEGQDCDKILNNSIMNGWKGVFPLKDEQKGQATNGTHKTKSDRANEAITRALAKYEAREQQEDADSALCKPELQHIQDLRE